MARRSELSDEPWHSLPIDEVLRRIGSDRDGLPSAEVARRLSLFGRNTLPREPLPTVWRLAAGN